MKKTKMIRDAVRQAAIKIHSKGQYPTYDKVKLLLDKSLQVKFLLLYKFWHEIVQELELRT
jgi:hypothetical protein